MKMIRRILFILPLLFLVACNWGHKETDKETTTKDQDSSKIMNNDMPSKAKTGVGPIKDEVVLGLKIDDKMAEKGEKLFNNKCATCHMIHESKRGPALGGVLDKRSPQFVMNMILDPDAMIENDPQIKALKSVYEIRMNDLGLTEEEAREIVEYLREY
ncbi:c-type cytochrome [Aequorivita capsosiphonis]|uniref:c-type cytochrome n=1 Tax=Aequorivita capsosiphonis TaxID=487317 RepID=UPI00041B1040|nr:cytochrome c [Aequorivita capsosiphonis]